MSTDKKNVSFSEDYALECPLCGNDYLHQGRVLVVTRDEDSDATVVDVVRGHNLSVTSSVSKEICHGRRQSLLMQFSCENCECARKERGNKWLVIYQHKGRTFMEWLTKSPDIANPKHRTETPIQRDKRHAASVNAMFAKEADGKDPPIL
jgi:hypothetical protein